MRRDDDRGQSIQIGAVLLFGALIVALSGYQAFVVPQQNERVEFSHSQTVQNQLQDLRNVVASTTGDASPRSVSVKLGTRYPPRIVAMNPGPPTGSLRTAGTGDPAVAVEIANARATGETGDFWNGIDVRNYPTGTVVYRPNYNVYGGAPTTRFEHSVLYNDFPGGTVTLTGQTFVDGNRITLVALNGSLSRTRTGATSVDVRPVSASTTTVQVTNPDPSSPVTLRLPTRLSQETWLALLEDQMSGPDGHVSSVDVTDVPGSAYDTLAVTMEAGENYTLRLAKAGVGTGTRDTTEAYLTDVAGNGSAVPEGGSQLLAVQVRDAYNNPIAGIEVTGDPEFGALDDPTVQTGSDGRAVFTYDAPNVSAETVDTIAFSYGTGTGGSFDADSPEDIEMVVEVQDTQVSAATGTSGGPYTLVWQSPATDTSLDAGADGATLPLQALVEDPTVINETTVDEATVDFALNDSDIGTLSRSDGRTDDDGEVSTIFAAEANGTVRIYAVSGGANDVINVTVRNVSDSEPVTTKHGIRYEGDLGTTTSNSGIQFDVRNVGDDFARVNGVRVRSRIDSSGHLYDDGDREIAITGGDADGYARDRDRAQDAYSTDNSSIDFTSNAVLSTSSGGDVATVIVRNFGSKPSSNANSFTETDLSGLTRVAGSDNWDVAVTLEFQGRDDVTFFFREP